MRGDVTIRVIDVTKENRPVVEERQIKNMITKVGKNLLCLLLAGAGNGDPVIFGKIKFGTGTTDPSINDLGITNPISTTDTGAGLNVVETYGTGSETYNQIKISKMLADTEGNSTTITELGLFTKDSSKMFSRLKIAPIAKSPSYVIKVDWVISFQ
jgi:hypothetical protein